MKRAATFLRKLADFIDPQIKPQREDLVITVGIEKKQFDADWQEISLKLEQLSEQFRSLGFSASL